MEVCVYKYNEKVNKYRKITTFENVDEQEFDENAVNVNINGIYCYVLLDNKKELASFNSNEKLLF